MDCSRRQKDEKIDESQECVKLYEGVLQALIKYF